jgi:hypothetical protein
LAACAAFLLVSAGAAAQSSQAQTPATYRVVRIAAGPRGSTSGNEYRLEEERTTFSRARDTQAIVYFQWEGQPGSHRLSGRWQGPSGTSTTSEFEYRAESQRFGAYWTLPLSPSTPLGKWTVEATIDGLPCGSFTIEVVDADSTPAAAPRRPLSQSEVYERLKAVFVQLRVTPDPGSAGYGRAGFLMTPDSLATAFDAIDAIDGIQALLPDGTRQTLAAARAWSNLQDWAILAVSSVSATALKPAADEPQVGDRCFTLDSETTGARVLAECRVVGRADTPRGGARLIVNFVTGSGTVGAPVVNDFGELIGLVGAGLRPGIVRFRDMATARSALRGAPVIPQSALRRPQTEQVVSFDELRARRMMLPPVRESEHVFSAGFAGKIQRDPIAPLDQRDQFSPADGKLFIFINWMAKQRLRGNIAIQISDEENSLIAQSPPGKADIRKETPTFQHWQVPVPAAEGLYRVEILFNGTPVWRGFFRVSR